MTLERGERIEVVGLQRKKQASNPILKKFSRVKSYADAFFMPVGLFRLLSRLGDGHRAFRSHFCARC